MIPSLFRRLKWRLTLTYTLVSLAVVLMLAWWGFIAVTVYLESSQPELSWLEILRGQVLPALQVILPSALFLVIPAILVSTYFGFLTARWLDLRLASLREATRAWRRGDFSVTAPADMADEIGHFGQELNQMAEELEILLQTSQELATLEERYRLARDLHDAVKQNMTAAGMQLSAAESMIDQDPPAARACLEEAGNLIHAAQQELSAIINELRPETLHKRGLAAALRDYLDRWSRQVKAEVRFEVEGDRSLNPSIELAVFRFAQEALANVARHSEASLVTVHLTLATDLITLRIRDDGRGFNTQLAEGKGLGLANMRERIEQAGGQVSLASSIDGGSEVIARIPLGAWQTKVNE